MSIYSLAFRIVFGRGDRKRDRNLKIPGTILQIKDISYTGMRSRYNLLDVLRPKNRMEKLPVIISVHGGGYVYGTKEAYQYYCAFLAEQGFAVVNFNYHLAPQKKFPTQLTELNQVFVWMTEYAEEYLFDIENVFLVGDSAGAQMASQYAAIYANREFASLYPFSVPAGIRIRAIALNCGIFDITEQGMIKTAESEKMRSVRNALYDDYLGRNRAHLQEMLNVSGAIDKNYPPTFVMTSAHDFLRPYAEPMQKLLSERGVEAVYRLYGEENQEYMGHVFHCNMNLQEAKFCNREECEFFKAHIG